VESAVCGCLQGERAWQGGWTMTKDAGETTVNEWVGEMKRLEWWDMNA
jgi:hypothetical protein